MIVLVHYVVCFFFFKQKTAYEMRISDWSSDVCSSDLLADTKKEISAAVKLHTFAEWQERFAIIDACVEPVLSFAEACEHPQIKAREMLVQVPSQLGRASCRESVCKYG